MNKLVQLLEKGVISTRVISFALTGVVVYMWLNQMPLDQTLESSWLIILGFWFNSELANQFIKHLIEEMRESRKG